jgi:hypothetical protein
VAKRLDGSTIYWQPRGIERKKGEKEIKRRSRKEKKEKRIKCKHYKKETKA